MNLNLYLHELKQYRLPFVIWCLSICALILLGLAFYPMLVQENFSDVLKFVFEFPMMNKLMATFNVNLLNLTNISSFYVAYTSIYVILTGCIFSITLAAKILAKEEYGKTAEFLLTRPLTRGEVFGSKLAVLFTLLVLLNLAIAFSGILGMELFKSDNSLLLNLKAEAKEQMASALQRSPRRFQERFRLSEQDYLNYTLNQALAVLETNPDTAAQHGIDPGRVAPLLREALSGPEDFLARVQASPEEYRELLGIPAGDSEQFMQGLKESGSQLAAFRARLQTEPELYVELFIADPARFLDPFKHTPGELLAFLIDFGLPAQLADELFVYYHLDHFLILCFYVFLLMLWMVSLGLLLSQLIRRENSVTGACIGITLACYFFNSLSNVVPASGLLAYLSPFKFVDPDILNPAYGLQWWRVLYFTGCSFCFTLGALLVFRKKDILV